jgi:hypothetical protein
MQTLKIFYNFDWIMILPLELEKMALIFLEDRVFGTGT